MKTTVTFEDKKKKAIELMEELGIYKPYIRGFKQDNTICYFEQYAGFWAYQDEELMKKIKEFEERTGKTNLTNLQSMLQNSTLRFTRTKTITTLALSWVWIQSKNK